LTSVPSTPRSALQANTLETAKEYEREARRRIQQMNIVAADLEIKGGKRALAGIDDMFDDGRQLRSMKPQDQARNPHHIGGFQWRHEKGMIMGYMKYDRRGQIYAFAELRNKMGKEFRGSVA
jgi:hypothetical protein